MIPFADNYEVVDLDGNHADWVVRCPECGAYITEHEMKDEESFTGSEYAEHYAREHEGEPVNDPRWCTECLDAGRSECIH